MILGAAAAAVLVAVEAAPAVDVAAVRVAIGVPGSAYRLASVSPCSRAVIEVVRLGVVGAGG